MNKRIAFTRPDGGVSVVVPAPNARRAKESDEDFLARVQARSVPADAIEVVTCEAGDLPGDREFRGAWALAGGKVAVDMVKAQAIQLERIRAARDTALRALDLPQLRALVAKDEAEVARIEAEKQALRDLPATLDLAAATTPEDLKAIWPAELEDKAAVVAPAVTGPPPVRT